MTLCAKDEADVLNEQLAFHLNAGVDHVIVTDTGSTDGTLEILERYARAGVLTWDQDASTPFRQDALVTRMARRAASELGADWVLNADADEFWWPRGPDLKAVLRAVPERYGIVRGLWRPFIPILGDAPFFERMTIRLAPQAALNEPERPFRPHSKIAHRADPDIRVITGNHDVDRTTLQPLRGWYPIEVLHFPLRTLDQVNRKQTANSDAWGRRGLYGKPSEEVLAPLLVGEQELAEGRANGTLFEDTRLRDALRTLREAGDGTVASELVRLPLEFPAPSIVDDALYAVDVAVLTDADEIRLRRGLDVLDLRQKAIERLLVVRLEQRLRSWLGAFRG